MKKLFIISSSLLAVFLVFLLAYNFAFKKDSQGSEEGKILNMKNNSFGGKEESSGNGKTKLFIEEQVVGIFLNKKNETLSFHSFSDGKAWQVDLEGEKKKNIADKDSIGLREVLWSPTGERYFSVFGQGGWQNDFILVEEGGNKNSKLGSGTDAVAWDNLGTKIIYKYFDAATKAQSISVANPDGSDWKKIADTTFSEVVIAPIPQTSLVSFWNEGKSSEETGLYVVGMNGGEAKKIFTGKFGADYKWSPDGKRALVSHLKGQGSGGLTTGLINTEGVYLELGIPVPVSKTEWSLDNKHIYYALPSVPEGAVMPDDYKNGKFKSTDTFWSINVDTGEKTRLLELKEIDGAYDASQLTLSPSEDSLYFVNKADNKVYQLDF